MNILTAAALAGLSILASTTNPIAKSEASPFVKIISGYGYGSGTYIGNGYFLTANHVANLPTATAKLSDGTVLNLELVTSNHMLDFAILRVVGPTNVNLEAVPIKCEVPSVGTHLQLHGNPAGDYKSLEFVYTNAEVIGTPLYEYGSWEEGHWARTIPVDGTVVWGMSGGGATNDAGELVGITVAVHIANNQALGIGFIVPTDHICGQIEHEGIDLG